MLHTEVLAEGKWPKLRELRLAALKKDPDAFLSTYDHEKNYDESKWRAEFSRGRWIIMLEQRSMVGVIGVTRERATPLNECYLEYLWVVPGARRSGVASNLVRAVLNQLAADKIKTVWLWVLEGNEPAFRLYRKLGFVFAGKEQPLPDNPLRSEVLMKLILR